MTGQIPIIETYRGVGIHDCQPLERIELVKGDIDQVFTLSDMGALFEWASDPYRSSESRLLAAAKCRAAAQMASNARRIGPGVDIELLAAVTAGLDSIGWRDARHFGTLLQHPMPPGAPPLPSRDEENGLLVEAAAKAARAQ